MGRLFLTIGVLGALLLGGADPDPGGLDAVASIMLERDAAPDEVKAIAVRLRGQPGVMRVEKLDPAAEFAEFKAAVADQPEVLETLATMEPGDLPERIEFQFRNRRAMEAFAASDGPAELRGMPGVDLVIIPLHESGESVSECTMGPDSMPGAPEMLDVKVIMAVEVTAAEKGAIEQRLHEVPGATGVTMTTRAQAFEEYQELRAELPDAPAVGPEALPESWVLTLVDRASVYRAVDEHLAEQICRMPGVAAVMVPPKG